MFRARLALACLLVLALPATAVAPAGGDATGATASAHVAPADGARIVEVYPNPVADGDAGEFVVLAPEATEATE